MREKDISTLVLMFPGQGSQELGMLNRLRVPRLTAPLMKMADRIVGDVAPALSLSALCEYGPENILKITSNAQPAIVEASLAAFKLAKHYHPRPFKSSIKYFAGHSVGEYSALAAARVLDPRTAIYLVRQRGLLMEIASKLWPGKMFALHGFESEEQVENLCTETGVEIANSNGPAQLIITGGENEVKEAIRIAGEWKMRPKELPISGGFHSSKMKPIQEPFREILSRAEFYDLDPQTLFILNATGLPATSIEEIKEELVTQLASSVKWWKSMEYALDQGATRFIEFGPKPILTGLLSRIDKNRVKVNTCINSHEAAKALSI